MVENKGAKGTLHPELAKRVQTARQRSGLTQADAAAKLGVSTALIAGIEQCRKGATMGMLRGMAGLYGTDEYYLVTGQHPSASPGSRYVAEIAGHVSPLPERAQAVIARRVRDWVQDYRETSGSQQTERR